MSGIGFIVSRKFLSMKYFLEDSLPSKQGTSHPDRFQQNLEDVKTSVHNRCVECGREVWYKLVTFGSVARQLAYLEKAENFISVNSFFDVTDFCNSNSYTNQTNMKGQILVTGYISAPAACCKFK